MRTLRRIQEQRVVWLVFAALAVAGQFADIVTTLAVLAAGGSEANPIGARLMGLGDWPLIIAAKMLLALALGWVLVAVSVSPEARRSWAGTFILLFVGIFAIGWWGVIAWNSGIWLVIAHALPWGH